MVSIYKRLKKTVELLAIVVHQVHEQHRFEPQQIFAQREFLKSSKKFCIECEFLRKVITKAKFERYIEQDFSSFFAKFDDFSK